MIKGESTNRKLNDFNEGDEVIVKFIDTKIDDEEDYQRVGIIDNISEDKDDDLPITVIFNGDKNEYDFYKPEQLELVDNINKQEKSKLKFKVGDKVKYVKENEGDDAFDKKYLGQFGEIIKIDADSTRLPYQIKTSDNTLLWLSEESLELAKEENKTLIEFRDNFIELKKFAKPTVVFRIDLNGNVYKIPIDERENYDEFSEEAIVALLDDDTEGYIEAVQNIENDYSEYIIKKIGEDLNV